MTQMLNKLSFRSKQISAVQTLLLEAELSLFQIIQTIIRTMPDAYGELFPQTDA